MTFKDVKTEILKLLYVRMPLFWFSSFLICFFQSVFSKKKKIKKHSFLDKLVLQASLKQMGSNMSKHFAESTVFQKGQSCKIPTPCRFLDVLYYSSLPLLLEIAGLAESSSCSSYDASLYRGWKQRSVLLPVNPAEKVLRCGLKKPLHPAQCRTTSELKEL